MALQLWLPLNKLGDFNNKGLADVTSDKAGTYNSSGKLGGCYSETLHFYLNTATRSSKFSICFWQKPTTTDFGGISFPIYKDGTKTTESFSIVDYQASNGTQAMKAFSGSLNGPYWIYDTRNTNGKWIVNTWVHWAFIVDSSSGKTELTVYVNGNLAASGSSKSNIVELADGTFTFSGTSGKNDLRVYDHCLSPKEVKEISKGLILHYPLNNPEHNINLLKGGNVEYTNKSYGIHTYIPSETLIAGDTYTITMCVTPGLNTLKYSAYTSSGYSAPWNFKTDGTTNKQILNTTAKCSFSSGRTPSDNIAYNNITIYRFPNDSTTSPYNNTIHWIKMTKGEDRLMYFWKNPNDSGYSNIEYDTSGYQNDGTITGTLTTSEDSPRYDKCTVFDGNSRINFTCPGYLPQKTLSGWIKRGDSTQQATVVRCSGAWLTLNSSGKLYCYSYGKDPAGYHTGTTIIPLNTWAHVACVWSDTHVIGYVNGNKEFEISCTGDGLNTLSSVGHSNSYLIGCLSDVRVYATALSEEDVKELYNTSTFVDNKQNFISYDFIENTGDSRINKSGVTNSINFLETADVKIFNDKIETNQLIEI